MLGRPLFCKVASVGMVNVVVRCGWKTVVPGTGVGNANHHRWVCQPNSLDDVTSRMTDGVDDVKLTEPMLLRLLS